MTPTVSPEAPTMPPPTPELGAFFEHVRYTNPFDVNRVGQAALAEADASQVHHAAFTQLTDLVGRARQQPLGLGAVLWGEAGIGKSHLLARLQVWAGRDHKQAACVYLSNLQAAPQQLPRSLLRAVVSILTHGRVNQFHGTLLYRLINATLRHALQYDGSTPRSWGEAEAAYHELIDDLCDRGPGQAAFVDRLAYAVLFEFFRSAYRAREADDDGVAALAVRWLAGDALDPNEARALGLPAPAGRDEVVALADDQQIRNVLVALAQVASYRAQPLVLCCDQVDSLEPEQFGALARFLHGLLDSASNLLVITCGLRETLDRWLNDGVIPTSTWDRLTQHEILLQRISPRDASQIVQARLQPFQEPFLTLEPVKELVQKDYLFPLGQAWEEEYLAGKIEVRPRDVINWAREGWRREQDALKRLGGPEWLARWSDRARPPIKPVDLPPEEIHQRIDDKVDLKLREHKQQRQLEPQTLPPDADNLAGLLYTLLQRCLNTSEWPSLLDVQRMPRPRYGPRPPYDIILRQRLGADAPEIRTGLLCLVVSSRVSMSAFLRRLVNDTQPPERLVLITEERRPLNPGPTGQEYLDQLRQRHGARFLHFNLTFDQYAELEALQGVVGLARSGDLEVELPGGRPRRVTEGEVIESHHRRQRYRGHPLLRLVLEPEPDRAAEVGERPALAGRFGSAPGCCAGAEHHDASGIPSAPPTPPPDRPNGFVADEKDLREFIMGRLAIMMGASSHELAVQYQDYLRRKQVELELPVCKARLEEVARKMHQDGLLHATPFDDNLSLMKK
ncbi:MAG TPA: ATP-binding protein [Gemmataceae bacterium]|nr:ATP-binding protein [Gemmataceae bacterium]